MKKRSFKGLLLMLIMGVVALVGSSLYAQEDEGPPPPPWQGSMSNAKEITFEGTVVALTFPVATVKTDGGDYYIVRLGPWYYWKEKGFTLKKGEKIKITGFQNDDLVFPKTIETSSGTISLRDEKGYPLWGSMRGPRPWRGGRYYCPPCWEPYERR